MVLVAEDLISNATQQANGDDDAEQSINKKEQRGAVGLEPPLPP